MKLMNSEKDFFFIGNFGFQNLISIKNVNKMVNVSLIGTKEECCNSEDGDGEYVVKATLIGFIKYYEVNDCHLE